MIRVCSRKYFIFPSGFIQETKFFKRKNLKYYFWLIRHKKWKNEIKTIDK